MRVRFKKKNAEWAFKLKTHRPDKHASCSIMASWLEISMKARRTSFISICYVQ